MKADKDPLGSRMKNNYEKPAKTYLTRRMPVVARIDGKAFHTLTKGMTKPFDEYLQGAMLFTSGKLLENIQGCKLAYTQSDEISLLLTDYDTLETDAWFGYSSQKLCSVAASIATFYFNFYLETATPYKNKIGLFDARFFNIPKEEVANYFIWRQKDAIKNSISMTAQNVFSHKELQKLSSMKLKDKLKEEKGIIWEEQPFKNQRGSCVVKDIGIDLKIPVFSENRNYIERHVFLEEV